MGMVAGARWEMQRLRREHPHPDTHNLSLSLSLGPRQPDQGPTRPRAVVPNLFWPRPTHLSISNILMPLDT